MVFVVMLRNIVIFFRSIDALHDVFIWGDYVLVQLNSL